MEPITGNTTQSDNKPEDYNHKDALNKLAHNYQHIKGWGIDADSENEPTYPMKHYTGDDHERSNYEKASQQPIDVEILHSNERPSVSAVFGATVPPSGLSGVVRRFAFRYSENSLKHWFTLVLADRINMIEGIVTDIKQGHPPKIFSEMGWKAEWKYNKKGAAKKVAVATGVSILLLMYFKNKKRSR
jgi:hypothetical protein